MWRKTWANKDKKGTKKMFLTWKRHNKRNTQKIIKYTIKDKKCDNEAKNMKTKNKSWHKKMKKTKKKTKRWFWNKIEGKKGENMTKNQLLTTIVVYLWSLLRSSSLSPGLESNSG